MPVYSVRGQALRTALSVTSTLTLTLLKSNVLDANLDNMVKKIDVLFAMIPAKSAMVDQTIIALLVQPLLAS